MKLTPIALARRFRRVLPMVSIILFGMTPPASFADCGDLAGRSCDRQAPAAETGVAATQSPLQSTPHSTPHSPLVALQSYLQRRGIDPNRLTAAEMVEVMFDWYRLASMGGPGQDELLFRYGGWSEGCVTGFKLSLLRRVGAGGDGAEQLAGITLIFEPSGQTELQPFSAQSSDAESLEVFGDSIRNSPAYIKLTNYTPLAVLVEVGGVR